MLILNLRYKKKKNDDRAGANDVEGMMAKKI